MKKERIGILLLTSLLCLGCNWGKSPSSSANTSSNNGGSNGGNSDGYSVSIDTSTKWGKFLQREGTDINFSAGDIPADSNDRCVTRNFSGKSATTLDIYAFNDVHGQIDELAKSGEYLRNAIAANPYSVVVGAGDLFQGSAISNVYVGRPMVDAFNCFGMDATAIGNHEFDWGIEKFDYLFDGDRDNGESNFAFLGANIFKKDDTRIDFVKNSIMVTRGDLKIGIVGAIGYGLESSIALNRIKDYTFKVPAQYVKEEAYSLRQQGASIVIATLHAGETSYSSSLNNELAQLTGNYRIDAILNGHSHSRYSGQIGNVPIIQAADTNRYIGKISLTLSGNNVVNADTDFIDVSSLSARNNYIDERIDLYREDSDAVFNVPLNKAAVTAFAPSYVGSWVADTMRAFTGADLALVNAGGIRNGNHFPIYAGADIKYSDLVGISPFDNNVILMRATGSQLAEAIDYIGRNLDSNYLSFGVTKQLSDLYINGVKMDTKKTYTIATVDYLFDKTWQFNRISDTVNTEVILNRLLRLDVLFAAEIDARWNPSVRSVIASC